MTIPLPPGLAARLVAARAHPEVAAFEHIEWDRATGAVRRGVCKLCRTAILGLRPLGDPIPVGTHAEPGGRRTLLLQPVLPGAPLAPYARIRLRMVTGDEPPQPAGDHITHCCRDCLTAPKDAGLLEALYCADVAQWHAEAEASGEPPAVWAGFFAMCANRRPVAWAPEEGV